MKVFTPDTLPWRGKVNYVDKNNRVLGYSMAQDCCEIFGHCILAELPASTSDPSEHALPDSVLEPYSFSPENPVEFPDSVLGPYSPENPVELPATSGGEGGMLAFRIVADGLPNLWVVIWNFHNGYYSHGWEFDGKEGSL